MSSTSTDPPQSLPRTGQPTTLQGSASARKERVERADQKLQAIRGEYPFRSHFAQVGGKEHPDTWMHYIDEGPEAAPALVFLHGNPTWSFAWRRAVRTLSERYRCIALDHVGCGLSDKPKNFPYRLANHIDGAERLVQFLQLERFSLVAHDWGGAIAMGLARRQPKRIERIALANTAAFPFGRIPWRIAACRVPLFGKLAVRGLNAFARAALYMTVEKPLPPTVKRGYVLPYSDYKNRIGVSSFVDDIPMAKDHPSRAELESIALALGRFEDQPVHLLWGMRDWCFTPAFLEEWTRIWPKAQVTRFDQAGHYVFEDEAKAFVSTLETFFAPLHRS